MEANATDASASNVVVPLGTNENVGLDQLPKELHEMKIRDDEANNLDHKENKAVVVNGRRTEDGHVISTTIGGRNGQPK
ncbi:hypothetical protein AMTR_s00087p00141750 [Amborella trichopoda]|uniref:Uncharacterized protein n=1 Tax=Amborella trichopoda TaxID=13333 RepID=W1NY97_AMBTC|nr:hypothetical protein AMTR_s00087p00141750 [Amborella trichopoda]